MSDYQHGTMNTYDHEKTFKGFLKLGKITVGICIGILLFLVIYAV